MTVNIIILQQSLILITGRSEARLSVSTIIRIIYTMSYSTFLIYKAGWLMSSSLINKHSLAFGVYLVRSYRVFIDDLQID